MLVLIAITGVSLCGVFVWWFTGKQRETLPRCMACNGVCVPNDAVQRFVCEDCNRPFSIVEYIRLLERRKP